MEEKRKLLHEILDLVLDINGFEQRKTEFSNKPAVFFDFSGHTASASVSGCSHGWFAGCTHDFQYDAWDYEGVNGLIDLKKNLERKKEELDV